MRASHLPPLLLAAGLTGCGFVSAGDNPATLAWRGGAGYWPENSRVAVDNALLASYDGLSVDVALTADEVPVLVRGPWLPHETCTTRADAAIAEAEVRIKDLTFEELNDLYVCGVVADPAFPDQVVARDGVATWQDLLDSLADGNQAARVHVHLVYEEGETVGADVIARQVLDQWFAAGVANPLTLAASDKALFQAIDEHAGVSAFDGLFDRALEWPAPPSDGAVAGYQLGADLAWTLGLADPVATASAWDLDGVVLAEAVADRQLARKARAAGMTVTIQVADQPVERNAFERWPVDAILTAYPEPAP